ncbi:glycosyltransferase [Halomonas sp. TRM85114]|uniref:glycosyltransferase n=1 Tax=Halomonas jincaotanensis TaxID=2810616 RepID=UPI001BD31729|nr:glycosyltransferase [Halomonas jincaotanensis]MBS9404245.1 glycosyltransferase [Halomonas jincaotanensis]
MKIAFITTGLDTGGAEVFLIDLLKSLKASGVDPLVISLTGKGVHHDGIVEIGVPVIALEGYNALMLPLLKKRVLKEVKRFAPDLIQGWMYHGNYIASDVGARLGVPVAWSVHHSVSDISKEKPVLRLLLGGSKKRSSEARFIQYCSQVSRTQHERIGFDATRGRIIPNGFDCDKFSPDEWKRATARRRLGVVAEHFLIAHIGRYHPMKDHANFLRAARQALDVDDRFRFFLIGPEVDAYNAELVHLRRELGIEYAVHFLGLRNDVDRLMHAFDLVSTSSAWGEAFPIVLGEAMACGIPCTATAIGDCHYLIGETGSIVPPRDPEALASAWVELMLEDATDRRTRSQAARKRILENFSIDAIAEQFLALYRDTLPAAKGDASHQHVKYS